jgi:hypothetical protein
VYAINKLTVSTILFNYVMSYYIMIESAGAEEQALDGIVMIIGLISNNVTFQSVLFNSTLFGC